MMRPRGNPPTPSARSRAIDPDEMTSNAIRSWKLAHLHDRALTELPLDLREGVAEGDLLFVLRHRLLRFRRCVVATMYRRSECHLRGTPKTSPCCDRYLIHAPACAQQGSRVTWGVLRPRLGDRTPVRFSRLSASPKRARILWGGGLDGRIRPAGSHHRRRSHEERLDDRRARPGALLRRHGSAGANRLGRRTQPGAVDLANARHRLLHELPRCCRTRRISGSRATKA